MNDDDVMPQILRELINLRKEIFQLRKTFTLFSEAVTENAFRR